MNTKRHCTYVKSKLFLKISTKMSILKGKKKVQLNYVWVRQL